MRDGLSWRTELTFADALRLLEAARQTTMRWRLDERQVEALVGSPLEERVAGGWCGPIQPPPGAPFRAMLLVEIDIALDLIFDREEDVATWLRRPDAALGGSPLFLMLRSTGDVERIRDLLWPRAGW